MQVTSYMHVVYYMDVCVTLLMEKVMRRRAMKRAETQFDQRM